MVRRILIALCALLCPVSALAGPDDVTKVAVFGDQQFVTSCTQATTAWTWGAAAFDWVAANDFDAMIQVGDITASTTDCECEGTADPGGGCGDIEHSLFGTEYCETCEDPEAMACAGGTPGLFCEWTRAQALADKLSIAQLWVPGNHDYDVFQGTYQWSIFTEYMGTPRGGIARGTHISTSDEGGVWTGKTLGADNFVLFQGAGQRFLVIGTHYFMDTESMEWAKTILAQYPGVPTIVVSHGGHTSATPPTGWDYDALLNMDGPKWLATFGPYPQVFLYICGHQSDMFVVEESSYGHKNLGVMIDYSYDDTIANHTLYDGVDSRQLEDYGGGGALGVMSIDVVAGKVSWYVYSPKLDTEVATHQGFDEHYDSKLLRSFWSRSIEFCGSSRFTMDPGACDDYVTVAPPSVIGGGGGGAY